MSKRVGVREDSLYQGLGSQRPPASRDGHGSLATGGDASRPWGPGGRSFPHGRCASMSVCNPEKNFGFSLSWGVGTRPGRPSDAPQGLRGCSPAPQELRDPNQRKVGAHLRASG